MTDKPTDAQVKEFWEWCGLKVIWVEGSFAIKEHWEIYNSYEEVVWDGYKLEDSIDLNNLWEYAVPKALGILAKRGYIPPIMKLFQLWYDGLVSLTGDSSNVEQGALALFWVLDKIKEDSNDTIK